MLRKSHLLALALSATALVPATLQSARAADVGARIYIQPWAPETAENDQVQMDFDDPRIVSDSVSKAWDAGKLFVRMGIYSALNGYRVGPGLTLAGGAAQLNPVTDFALSSAGPGAATLQFRVPNTVVSFSVGVKALMDADDYTAGLATGLLTPQFDIKFDIVLQLSLSVTGNAVTATAVHAIVQNPTITPLNDPAKALKGINDIVSFFGGPDFAKMIEDQINKKDLGSDSLVDSINKGLAPIGQAEQVAAANTGFSLITMWGDNNRLTFYYAPLPRTNIPAGGVMTGNVRWDPTQFPGANCASFQVFTDVQTGPHPLLTSDGQVYGVAPTQRIGRFSAHAAAHTPSGAANSCDYVITGLANNWLHHTSATTAASPANPVGGSNPQVGNLHSIGYMQPVGWDGLTVRPNPLAANKDYQLLRGMSGSQALGNPHVVMPGQKQQEVLVETATPRIRILQQPSQPVMVQQLPAPPAQTSAHLPDGGQATRPVPSQAPQLPPSPPATQGHASAPNPAPSQGSSQGSSVSHVDVARITETGKTAQTSAPGAAASINPQPLPPRVPQVATTNTKGPLTVPGRVMINPQPLPPKQPNGTNGIK